MEKIIESLKSSPMFNLSLTSKELFHSNFIYWLIRQYPNKMWNMFSGFLGMEEKKYRIKPDSVGREIQRIDLSFELEVINEEKTILVIIENKVKSLPYMKQLEEYSKKVKDPKKYFDYINILLSLSTPNHLLKDDKINDGKNEWYLYTYREFAEELKNLLLQIDEIKPNPDTLLYHKSIISDYIEFINQLSNIDDKTKINNNELFNWYDNDLFNSLEEIRLTSFFIKKKCENMALNIFAELEKQYPELIKSKKVWQNSSIVNSTNGEYRIYFEINKRITISIEISRMYYRKMVHIKNMKKEGKKVIAYKSIYKVEDVANFFKTEIKWFDFSYIGKSDISYKQSKPFLKFGNTTRYCQIKLDDNNSINDVISYFIHDFSFIITKKDIIIKKYN